MNLKIKSMREVFNNLVDWITTKTDKITDFNVGSAIRTLTEAIAIQFEEFYFSMKQNVLYAIENSIYTSFDFDVKLSRASSGYVTIEFEEPLPSTLTIPKGTVFCTSVMYGYIYFESTSEISVERGAPEALIPIQCKTSGIIGNVPAESITTIVMTHSIIKSVKNKFPLTNGQDDETSSERKNRFKNYVRTLARGTADSILYGALEVDGVTGAWVDDKYIGYVKVYAHNSTGELPAELKKEIIKNLQNYRAGGIEVEVLPIVKKVVDLNLKITIGNDYDEALYTNLIKKLIENYLNGFSVAKSLYISDIIHTIKSVYLEEVINLEVSSGQDIVISNNELIRSGNIEVKCVKVKDWRL